MNRVELEGVLAHELSHIKNYDILVSTLAVTMVGVDRPRCRHRDPHDVVGRRAAAAATTATAAAAVAVILAIFGFVLLILAPLIARLMQFAVSRRRESLADVSRRRDDPLPAGADLGAREAAGRPDGRRTPHRGPPPTSGSSSRTARTPEEGRLSRINRLFDTHPPLEERIAALQEL